MCPAPEGALGPVSESLTFLWRSGLRAKVGGPGPGRLSLRAWPRTLRGPPVLGPSFCFFCHSVFLGEEALR